MVEALYTEEPDAAYLSRIAGPRDHRRAAARPGLDQASARKACRRCAPGASSSMARMTRAQVPHGVIPMRIEAGLAFGTGHHETTALCLAVLSDLATRRALSQCARSGLRHRPARHRRGETVEAAGAGVRHRSGRHRSDRRECARAMAWRRWSAAVVADGLTHPALAARRALRSDHRQHPGRTADPAGAADRRARWRPAATLVLSGLLHNQEAMILSFLPSPAVPRPPPRRPLERAGLGEAGTLGFC